MQSCWHAAISALQAGDISKQIEVLFQHNCKACPGGQGGKPLLESVPVFSLAFLEKMYVIEKVKL